MQRHISPIAKQRISDFFTQEDGNVGRKNALMAGTILSSAMLAAALFAPQTANAAVDCGDGYHWCGSEVGICCSDGYSCCSDWYWSCCPWEKVYFYYCVEGPFCEPQDCGV